MAGLALLLSIIALIVAYLAYRQSGGTTELQSKVEDLGITTESLRDKTADAIGRIERIVRGEAAKSETSQEDTQEASPKAEQKGNE
jgi:hypothetical protein